MVSEKLSSFRHKTEIQVHFSDVDMMGHVNNACYFTYVEDARLKYYDEVVGADTDWHTQHGLIMARFEIDYKKALSYGDKVFVYTKCSKLGNKSFDLHWIITIKTNETEEIAAEGKTVIVCYDYDSKQGKAIPEERRKLIQNYENMPA